MNNLEDQVEEKNLKARNKSQPTKTNKQKHKEKTLMREKIRDLENRSWMVNM